MVLWECDAFWWTLSAVCGKLSQFLHNICEMYHGVNEISQLWYNVGECGWILPQFCDDVVVFCWRLSHVDELVHILLQYL